MASLQSNSTFSVEHHLTGEAFLAWYLHIVRTSTIAKNRHLTIVLRAELYLRTGTYDRPKNTLAIACPGDAPGPLSPWRSISVWPATYQPTKDNMVGGQGRGKVS